MKNSEELIKFWKTHSSGLSLEDIEWVMSRINETNFFPNTLFLHPTQMEALQSDQKFVFNVGRKQGKTRVNRMIQERKR